MLAAFFLALCSGNSLTCTSPPGRPYSTALEDNIWWYKDRAGLPRGPLQLTGLRACYVQGVIDDKTLVWGQGLTGWYPMTNVIGLTANVRNLESALGGGVKRCSMLSAHVLC